MMFRKNALKILKALYFMQALFIFLKTGKSTDWEDDGWGAWEETEPQEPVSLYKCMHVF